MSVRRVAPGFSPLDEALGLRASGGRYSPHVLSWLVRLGAEVPFARAAFWLEELTGIAVSAATVRRHTEAVGATAVRLAEEEVARLERETPVPQAHPERLVVGADGAMVPLVGGEWAEVKLLNVGVPRPSVPPGGAPTTIRTQQQSYFARLADAETFGRQALGELHRRGLERAAAVAAVAAVQDGAPWLLQGFVDLHRPDALRILDWPHAAQHLTGVAEAVFGIQTARAQRVAERLRRRLWEEGPPRVLAILAGWERAHPDRPAVATAVAYFRERAAQLDYPAFRAAGWPVGSGATESGHKQVMQARMKRAGMRWARPHVNPLLAVTLVEHNGRWGTGWGTDGPLLLAQHRAHCVRQRQLRQHARRAARQRPSEQRTPCAGPRQHPATTPSTPTPPTNAPPLPALPAKPRLPATPTCHPWRHYNLGWLSAKN